MTRTRILIGEMPRMLRDIIEGAVRPEPDIELIEDDGEDLDVAVQRRAPDVLIVAEGWGGPASHARLLLIDPGMKLFVISDDGRQAQLLEFRRCAIRELSIESLVAAIRTAVRGGWESCPDAASSTTRMEEAPDS